MTTGNKATYLGIALMALGIAMLGIMVPAGVVFMGVGAYFFIVGMAKRKKEQSEGKTEE